MGVECTLVLVLSAKGRRLASLSWRQGGRAQPEQLLYRVLVSRGSTNFVFFFPRTSGVLCVLAVGATLVVCGPAQQAGLGGEQQLGAK